MSTLLLLLSIWLAINFGGSSFGPSFASPYGCGIISKKKAIILYLIFVLLGSICLGKFVTTTLSSRIIPTEAFSIPIAIAVIFSTSISVFIANLLHIPQSTSITIVAALTGVGIRIGQVHIKTLLHIVPFWLLLPLISFFVTLLLGKYIYPPREQNFWLYEKVISHQNRLKKFVLIASCYNAFAIGSNNVPNVAGPIVGSGILPSIFALGLFGILFGIGGSIFHGPLRTASTGIVPIGLMTATIISFVSGTLLIVASSLGIPQSFAMIKMSSIFAIGSLKDGHTTTFSNPNTYKTYIVWIISPVISLITAYLILGVIYALYKT